MNCNFAMYMWHHKRECTMSISPRSPLTPGQWYTTSRWQWFHADTGRTMRSRRSPSLMWVLLTTMWIIIQAVHLCQMSNHDRNAVEADFFWHFCFSLWLITCTLSFDLHLIIKPDCLSIVQSPLYIYSKFLYI